MRDGKSDDDNDGEEDGEGDEDESERERYVRQWKGKGGGRSRLICAFYYVPYPHTTLPTPQIQILLPHPHIPLFRSHGKQREIHHVHTRKGARRAGTEPPPIQFNLLLSLARDPVTGWVWEWWQWRCSGSKFMPEMTTVLTR